MKSEEMRHAINEIFKASKSIREALDTLDLGHYMPQGGEVEELEAMQERAERIAQQMQAKAKAAKEKEKTEAEIDKALEEGDIDKALEILSKPKSKTKA